MKDPFKFDSQPQFQNPSLIVGWNRDAGKVAPKVIDFLNEKIGGQQFCEIEPVKKMERVSPDQLKRASAKGYWLFFLRLMIRDLLVPNCFLFCSAYIFTALGINFDDISLFNE